MRQRVESLPVDKILAVARSHGATEVKVFGSRARGDATRESDLDLLVDLEPGRNLLDVIGMQQDLEDLLAIPVQVLTEGDLSPYMRDRIMQEARPLAAA